MGMRIFCWFEGLCSKRNGKPGPIRWRDALPRLAGELDLLAKSTEGQFLSIGEKLQDFYGRTGELSRSCSSIAGQIAGEELGTIIEGFRSVIDGINQLESGSRRNTDYLRNVLEKLDHLDSLSDGFQKIIMLLKVLCVSIRIESARLGERDSGFDTLAEEVEKLSREIQQRCSKLHESCRTLNLMIGHALSRVLELEGAREKHAGMVLEKTMSGLESLLKKHEESSKAAQQISTHYETVSQRIGEIVLSMQFHDITRQRLEHARDALTGLVAEKRGENGSPSLVAEVASLQALQLKNARNELVSAVESILGNLSTLGQLVAGMARQTSRLAGNDNDEGNSFLTQIEEGFASVMSALGMYGESDLELSETMNSVSGMFGEISTQAGSIEAIGAKIKLISLNAIVKACHIGEEGASLAVLAESTHQISVETCTLTTKASEALRSTISVADSLRAAVSVDESSRGFSPARVCEMLGSRFQTLESANRDIFSTFEGINTEGGSLCEDIRKVVGGVSVHQQVKEGLDRIVATLEGIAAFSRSQTPRTPGAETRERLEALKAGYTMQTERNVHDALWKDSTPEEGERKETADPVEAAQSGKSAREDEPPEATEDDLGDNVELF